MNNEYCVPNPTTPDPVNNCIHFWIYPNYYTEHYIWCSKCKARKHEYRDEIEYK